MTVLGVEMSALAGVDLGSDRDSRPAKLCAERMKHHGWCLLADGHGGPHAGIPRSDTPVHASKLFGPIAGGKR